jgi:hypothetical protein
MGIFRRIPTMLAFLGLAAVFPGQGCACGAPPDGETGSPCSATDPCNEGFACQIAEDGETALCAELVESRAAGEACDNALQCASGACVGDDEKTCVETCPGRAPCEDPLKCFLVEVNFVCLTPLDDRVSGEACDTPRQCASGYCVDVPHVGNPTCFEPCEDDGSCPGDLGCHPLEFGGQVCVPLAEDGAACESDDVCAGGHCVKDTGQSGDPLICASACGPFRSCDAGYACVDELGGEPLCAPLVDDRGLDESCDRPRQCLSGHCVTFDTGDGILGTLCAEPCGDSGTCPDDKICWEAESGPDVCGPIP